MRVRRSLAVRGRWLLPGVALALAGCAIGGDEPGVFPQDAMDPAGPIAASQDRLWNLVFPIAVAVFVLVMGLLVVSMIKFRYRGETEPPRQVHGNVRAELVWTIIPALILAVVVAPPTLGGIFTLAADPGDEALQVRVIGKQFWWEFEYLGDEGQDVITANELHIPTNRPVRLTMEALNPQQPDTFDEADPEGSRSPSSLDGVIHSFWIPRLAGKQDVVPGHERAMTIEAEEPGTYEGQCGHFCGLGHALMRMRVIAQSPDEFEDWLDAQAEPAVTDLDGLAAEGEATFEEAGCMACHNIDGYETAAGDTPEGPRIGPDLTHFASRERFAGAIFDNDDADELAAWLRNPPEVKQGSQMPDLGLSEDQIEALVAYLQSLE
jgi:cytochrome c oxidase subunit II